MNNNNRLAYNAINKMQSSKTGQEAEKKVNVKEKKYFIA